MTIILFELIKDYLNKNPLIKVITFIVIGLIVFVIFTNILSKFLQNLDYLSMSLKRHFIRLFNLFKKIIKLIFHIIFMPFVFLNLLKEYKHINSTIINNSRYKDVS